MYTRFAYSWGSDKLTKRVKSEVARRGGTVGTSVIDPAAIPPRNKQSRSFKDVGRNVRSERNIARAFYWLVYLLPKVLPTVQRLGQALKLTTCSNSSTSSIGTSKHARRSILVFPITSAVEYRSPPEQHCNKSRERPGTRLSRLFIRNNSSKTVYNEQLYHHSTCASSVTCTCCV